MRYQTIEIDVHGHVGAGKTAILSVIEKALIEAFGVSCVSPELDAERRMGDPDAPAEWEKPSPKKHIIVLSESNPKTANPHIS